MQTAASISQDITNLKQASARIQVWRGSLLSGEQTGFLPKIFVTTGTLVPPHKMAAISPHLCLSFFFCCCVVFSTWTQACSSSVQLDISVYKCSKILQGRKHYTNNLLSDLMFIWLCAYFLHFKMYLCSPVPILFKEVYVFSCLVLSLCAFLSVT